MSHSPLPRSRAILLAVVLLGLGSTCLAADKVPVFILAGQSNMQGKASLRTLEYQITAPDTQARFAHLHDGSGQWRQRDDVAIKFLDRHGPLQVGYGSPGRFGPELGFGWVVGDALDQPVLIIKAAYGGRSLFRDFRSPSAGLPDDAYLQTELENAQNRVRRENEQRGRNDPLPTLDDIKAMYGFAYRDMLGEVRETLANYETLFPALKGKELELAGFVWFQGWNDMINPTFVAAYTENMAHFIRDVRKDLAAPELPFIIGQLGVGGVNPARPNPRRDEFKAAQAAAAELPEFRGNVGVVKTDQYWDETAQAVFDKGWRDNLDEWRKHGDDFEYHYLGSPRCILAIGEAFGRAMLELRSGDR